jgi:DNA topoisomerase-2
MAEDLADKYQKKTDREHILDTPDTYIGSIEEDEITDWVFSEKGIRFKWGKTKIVPGLYKCFDEGIVNARDHRVRLQEKIKKGDNKVQPVNTINISVDRNTGIITIINDGDGIDVAMHPEHNIWIPEMIFGHLRTSTNYKKDEKKIVGGKNGFGFKLVLIYSLWGKIETVDANRGLKYTQEFKDNLSVICKPVVRKSKHAPYTKVSFLLDYKRFGLENLTMDMFNIIKKRTFDMAAVTDKSVIVRWNGKILPVRSFETYIDCYIGKKTEVPRIYERANERWEYVVCLSPLDEFTQVSFVNGIHTKKGGKHVDYILNQIIKKLIVYIDKRKKVKVKPSTIKEQIMLFVNSIIVNPTFDSQTKEFMNLPVRKFGSSCEISSKFVDKIAKLGVMETALLTNIIKEKNAGKKTDGKKIRGIRGIPKLIDANWAGGPKSSKCILILCEGDSAKGGIVSGLSKEDRNTIGVFPLKGKLMNTSDTSPARINNNNEINNIKKILGLVGGKKYKNRAHINQLLRYGSILFMTDQDLDGSHIKGLCVNMFHSLWNDLLKIPKFLGFMNTPILKAKKGKKELKFYNDGEIEIWKEKKNIKGWKMKYYKGLGTSTAKEFKEYFAEKKIVHFKFTPESDDSLDLVFNKKRSDDRKIWLSNYDRRAVLDTNKSLVSYDDFINREMIHFSKYDCERSIPNLMDGWKISQRKAAFSAFKRKLYSEVKVAQLTGYISEHSAYHHGEASLNKTVIGMAQEFTGSNNIALFMPNGQFGTRLMGGKDSASERYIFTQLNPITKLLFNDEDKCVLNYLDDDGTKIEPDFYVPIIPMVLVNGSEGIGTGFSSKVLCYNPLDLTNYILAMLNNKKRPEIEPYYEGFKGRITNGDDKWYFQGDYCIINHNTVQILELPVGVWIQDFKEHIEKLMESTKTKKAIVKSYTDMSTDVDVDFTIKLVTGELQKLMKNNKFEKTFKLITSKSTTNQYLFDNNQQIKKYASVEDIILAYFPVRYKLYEKRKEYQIAFLKREIKIISNKARFIKEQCDDILDLRRKKKNVVIQLLKSRKYNTLEGNYNYLTKMPIDSVIEENIQKLLLECKKKEIIMLKLEKTTIAVMWTNELLAFKRALKIYRINRHKRATGR